MLTASAGNVVIFHYTLTDDEGTTIDSSRDRNEPMPYLHGAQNIVPGLETQLEGKAAGDKLVAIVAPADGYGESQEEEPEPVPRTEFPPEANLVKGNPLQARTPDGQVVQLWVAKVESETIWLTHEHPLAGVTLHFDVEIVNIREATTDEKAHGHPHGIDGTAGHHH